MPPLTGRFQAQPQIAAELLNGQLGEPYLISRGVNPTF